MHKNKNQRRSGLSCWNTLPSCQGAITASRFPPAEHLTPHTSKKPSERRHHKKGTARGPSRGAARFPPREKHPMMWVLSGHGWLHCLDLFGSLQSCVRQEAAEFPALKTSWG